MAAAAARQAIPATPADARLAAIERTGLVRRGHHPRQPSPEMALPVAAELRSLLPAGLPRGGTIAVTPASPAGTSLLMLLLAAASQGGAWCALVGLPNVNPAAAAEAGIALDRLALLPDITTEWSTAASALLDGVEIVVVATHFPPPAAVCGRLAARARQRGAVLLPYGPWQHPDLTLHTEHAEWEGLGTGCGRLQCRQVSVVATGRGTATRPRRTTLWLPQPAGLYAQRRTPQQPAAPHGRRLTVLLSPHQRSSEAPRPSGLNQAANSVETAS